MPERDNIIPFERPAGYWVRRARRLQDRDRLPEASAMLREAYRQSKDEKIALELAETNCGMGSYAAARRIAEDLLSRDPNCAGAYYIIGLVSLAYDDERLADDALATCLNKDRSGVYAEKAQALLNDYIWRIDPVFPRAARAEVLHAQALDALWDGKRERAEQLLTRAVRQGKRPQAETMLGEMYLRRGQVKEALRLFQKAERKLPGRPTQRLLLAQALCAGGRPGLAAEWLKKTLPMCESIPELALAAESCLYAGRKDLILRRIREVQKELPLSNDLEYLLAAVCADTWDFDRAVRHLMIILNRDPEDGDALAALRVIGLGPVPLDRPPVASFVYDLCARPPVKGDAALKRLAHGLTISLSGALGWRTVWKMTENAWSHLSPLQRSVCDRDRDCCWQNAFYLWLRERSGVRWLPQKAALYRKSRQVRRVRRMKRYIEKQENWRRIK